MHAIRNLARLAFGTAAVRWAQLGYGRTSSTSTSQETPRNLFGFKDGTANIKAEETADIERFVWVRRGADAAADWMADGSYLVVAPDQHAHRAVGPDQPERAGAAHRARPSARAHRCPGAPSTPSPTSSSQGRDGPLMAVDSHVRLAHPDFNNGSGCCAAATTSPTGPTQLGRLDAGLFFIAFVNDPAKHYVPMQTTLSQQDGLMEYLQHTGSGLFAVPPGAPEGSWVGEPLFA